MSIDALRDAFHRATDDIREFRHRRYSEIGRLVLDMVVKPYCDKHGMRYTQVSSGYSGFFFTDGAGERYFDDDLARRRRPKPGRPRGAKGGAAKWFIEPGQEEKDMIGLLSIVLSCEDCVGRFVPSYTPEGGKHAKSR